jgi:hypothetical protein
MCNQVYEVPSARVEKADGSSGTWSMRTPEGQVYGPVSRDELNRWVAEGRVTADCQVRDSDGSWQEAGRLFPALHIPDPAAPRSVPRRPSGESPFRQVNYQRARQPRPHRGALILALGILSWLSCPLFGVFAWILGNSDLRDMRAGRMDPEGMSLTQAGQILGMAHVILGIVILVFFFFIMLLIGVAAH